MNKPSDGGWMLSGERVQRIPGGLRQEWPRAVEYFPDHKPELARELERVRPREASLVIVAIAGLVFALVMLWVALAFADGASQPAVTGNEWQGQLLELAGAALLAGLTWASAALKAYFAAHAKGAIGNYALGVYQRLDDAVVTAVTAVEQSTVRDLAAGVSKKSAEQAKADALAYAKSYLGPKGLAELAGIVGLEQVAGVLSGKIESAVLAVNQGAAAGAGASAKAGQ